MELLTSFFTAAAAASERKERKILLLFFYCLFWNVDMRRRKWGKRDGKSISQASHSWKRLLEIYVNTCDWRMKNERRVLNLNTLKTISTAFEYINNITINQSKVK